MLLEANPNVDFWQDMVVDVLVEGNMVVGVELGMGMKAYSKAVVLTNGTFLNGLIHLGEKQFGGGRMGEKSAYGITESLVKLGFESGRMKTGTPPRVDGRSLNYDKMEVQHGDENPSKFSFSSTLPLMRQLPCYITYSNEYTHDTLREGFDRSPMFNGAIKSTGPRYCPSIEDKINRFADKDRHQMFVEPEGWNTVEIYVNGFSTSLPEDIQYKAMITISGFENVKMFRPGYAIEYDYFPPTQLKHTLETKLVRNLFFAGQINGTTGYEEAACQGMMAGINAVRAIRSEDGFILNRDEAYIGVLIDDLITKGTKEPYRMFTSRAEHRILLRQDNADIRLSGRGFSLGLLSEEALNRVYEKEKATNALVGFLRSTGIRPDEINDLLLEKGSSVLNQQVKLSSLVVRPELTINDVVDVCPELDSYSLGIEESFRKEVMEQAEILLKYDGYIEREKQLAEKSIRLESVKIPSDIDFKLLKSLSSEAVEKLSLIRPATIGQASRISGISPSDIAVLLVHMGR
jgi:tRNA uridine 5-carboxymethylaminomethyl modification enzyme